MHEIFENAWLILFVCTNENGGFLTNDNAIYHTVHVLSLMLSYLRRFSILVLQLWTRIFAKTAKISVFKHIGIRVDESMFLTFGSSLTIDMKVFASRAYPIASDWQILLFIFYSYRRGMLNTSPNRLQIISWYLQ